MIPIGFEYADGFMVFKRNRKLVYRADAPAAKKDRVAGARKNEVAPWVSEAGVDDHVHILDREIKTLDVLFFGICGRESD